MPRSIRSAIALAVAPAAMLIAATGAAAQTDVPRGGADIPVGAGSGQAVLKVRNTTGSPATDVTVSVFNTENHPVPNITGVDIVGTDKDHVDDNGDGDTDDADPGEDDTTDATPGKTAKSVLSSGKVNNNATIDVAVNLDGDLPAGTSFRVKFSTDIGGTHYDMCSVVPIDPAGGTGFAMLTRGSAQGAPGVITDPGFAIGAMHIFLDPANPLVFVQLPEPYQDSVVQILPDGADILLSQPIPGDELVDVGLVFTEPITEVSEIYVEAETFPWTPPPDCIADYNEDGALNILDFVAFQQGWKDGDPYADVNGDGLYNILDFVDFQQAFKDGCPETVVAVDDDFEGFELGPVCGQGDWEPWYVNPDNCATVAAEQSYSLPQALRLVGAVEAPKGDDAVRIISGVDEGVWSFTVRTLVPDGATGRGWVVLLNTYSAQGDKNWSLALALDADQGLIQENPIGKQNPPTLPLVYDEWAPIEVLIDLDADECDVYYDGQLLLAGQSWSAGMNAPGKAAVEALHLDAGDPAGGGISVLFVDDVRLQTIH